MKPSPDFKSVSVHDFLILFPPRRKKKKGDTVNYYLSKDVITASQCHTCNFHLCFDAVFTVAAFIFLFFNFAVSQQGVCISKASESCYRV